MRTDLLLGQFDTLVETPEVARQLERGILDLAVRGTLVPQDPKDEPASVLLERIKAQKHQLVLDNEIRKPKRLPPISLNEIPFELPESWIWRRLAEVSLDIHYGYTASADFSKKGYRLLRITDIQDNAVEWKSVPGCEIDNDKALKYLLRDGDILIARTGGTIGKSYLVRGPIVKAVFASYLIRVIPVREVEPRYLKLFLESSLYWGQLLEHSKGTGQPNVNATSLSQLMLPLPPLAEQKRIVARVDELLSQTRALSARLERAQADRLPAAQASFQAFTGAPDAAARREAWQRIADHFDPLTGTPETIDALKQTILQLAVQGKLVPQDPDDEPASSLVERISVEKEKLVAAGKIRTIRSISSTMLEQEQYTLPDGWLWTRLMDLLVEYPRNGYSPKPVNYRTGIKRLSLSATTTGTFDPTKFRYVDISVDEDSYLWLSNGDILIQRSNSPEYVGTCALYVGSSGEFIYPDLMMKMRAHGSISNKYLCLALSSPQTRQYFRENASGTSSSMPKINQKIVCQAPVLLPPLAEQKRIVAKVEQLMALCDALGAEVAAAEEVRGRLLQAVLNGA